MTETPPRRRGGVLLTVPGVSLDLKLALWWAVAGYDPSRFFSNDSRSYLRRVAPPRAPRSP